jgi:16S rRNA G966 N2-methylase RsmD
MNSWLTENESKRKDAFNPSHLNDTSIFDPALCEVLYKWFCKEGGLILDPFAGGSVRGIVANYLGYKYTGIDIRQEQIDSNREQAMDILPITNQPNYYVGDSDVLLNDKWNFDFDTIFSCPPYMDLEVYSDRPDYLSTLSVDDFIFKYEIIIKKSCDKLKKDGFAIFVVGDVRDKKTGYYKDFITITKMAFYKAGLKLYNEAILLENGLNTAAMRADKQFTAGKKLVKVHQNVLIFKKP